MNAGFVVLTFIVETSTLLAWWCLTDRQTERDRQMSLELEQQDERLLYVEET